MCDAVCEEQQLQREATMRSLVDIQRRVEQRWQRDRDRQILRVSLTCYHHHASAQLHSDSYVTSAGTTAFMQSALGVYIWGGEYLNTPPHTQVHISALISL